MDYGLWKLRFTLLGTLALVIGASTLFLTIVLLYLGTFDIMTMVVLVVAFNFIQWLIAPYLVNGMYSVREVPANERPEVHGMLQRISQKAGLKLPKLMLSPLPVPNAFAYGSPLTGSRVCVTQGLLDTLEPEEVEAVLGHELGHLRHRDVQIMMFVSVLPAIFYFIGYSLMWSGVFYSGRKNNNGGAVAVGMLALLAYFILNLLVLGLSRTREYYADRHGAEVVDDGARKLSEALAKLDAYGKRGSSKQGPSSHMMGFKSLLIVDPDTSGSASAFARSDSELVEEVAHRKVTGADRLFELFSTHPNIVKRIRALKALERGGSASQ